MKPVILAWIVVAIGILTANTAAHAPLPDLDSCHDDLDLLRSAASDASDAAQDAKSKHDELEDCRGDSLFHMKEGKKLLRATLRRPGVYVLYRNDEPYHSSMRHLVILFILCLPKNLFSRFRPNVTLLH